MQFDTFNFQVHDCFFPNYISIQNLSDQNQESENINVHSWSWVTNLTQKLFLPKMNFQNHVSDKHPQSENINVDSIDVFIDIFEISSSVTNLTWETVSSLNEYSNHVSDKHPQSENINVHALDVLIEIFEIWSWVTSLTYLETVYSLNEYPKWIPIPIPALPVLANMTCLNTCIKCDAKPALSYFYMHWAFT